MSISFGPSGGTGGNAFSATVPTDNGPWRISTVQVWSGDRIDAIELIWRNPEGATRTSNVFGGKSGGSENEFNIDAGDYLTRIEGSVGSIDHNVRVFSLQLFTKNGNSSKVFGKSTPVKFHYDEVPGQQIDSIFGRSAAGVDALGVIVDPVA